MTSRISDPRELLDQRLLRRIHDGRDPHALDRLVQRFQPFLRKTIRPYVDRGQPTEDLLQVANLGLVKAINGFDVDRGGRFVSYVAPTVQGEIKRHFRDHAWALHVPRSVKEAHASAMALADDTTHGDPFSVRRLSERAGHDRARTDNVVAADRAFRTTPIDAPSAEGATVGDSIGSVDGGFERAEERATIAHAFRRLRLSPKERRILVLRHLFGWNQYEIAADIGQSQMHVSRQLRALHERLGEQGDHWRRNDERARRTAPAA